MTIVTECDPDRSRDCDVRGQLAAGAAGAGDPAGAAGGDALLAGASAARPPASAPRWRGSAVF